MNIDDYTKLLTVLLEKVGKMEQKRFYSILLLIAFGLVLFALPQIITALRWW